MLKELNQLYDLKISLNFLGNQNIFQKMKSHWKKLLFFQPKNLHKLNLQQIFLEATTKKNQRQYQNKILLSLGFLFA